MADTLYDIGSLDFLDRETEDTSNLVVPVCQSSMLMILDKKQQEFIDIGSVVTKASSVILFLLAIGYPKLRLLANTIG